MIKLNPVDIQNMTKLRRKIVDLKKAKQSSISGSRNQSHPRNENSLFTESNRDDTEFESSVQRSPSPLL